MSNQNFVSVESGFDQIRRKNFFIYAFISSFVWMCFHFTLVFFFWLQLQSVLLVWLFLWFWNLISFLVDSPIWVLQKYFTAKKIFIFSAILMLLTSIIFLYFIYYASQAEIWVEVSWDILSKEMFTKFISSSFNIFLLLISVTFYWIIKELSDVTSLSYIMNNSDPSEYAELISKNNIFSWIWCLTWLITSGIILLANSLIAVLILVIIVIIFILFIIFYFDNSKDTISIDFADIKKLKLISPKNTIESVKQYVVTQVQKTDFLESAKNIKYIFLKPIQLKNEINWKEIINITKSDIKYFYNILLIKPYSYKLLVLVCIVTFFSFWDTFVVTFLIDFLDKIAKWSKIPLFTWYIFIAILALPAYWLQLPIIWIAKKVWNFIITLTWVIVSWVSIFMFWLFDGFLPILILWILNSVWYAAAMPLSQWDFSDEYNSVYAQKNNLNEIDSNASSAPLKMVLNLANVIWLIIWWFLVYTVWFNGTFLVFWTLIISFFILVLIKKKDWNLN